jgi:hypothetical protein
MTNQETACAWRRRKGVLLHLKHLTTTRCAHHSQIQARHMQRHSVCACCCMHQLHLEQGGNRVQALPATCSACLSHLGMHCMGTHFRHSLNPLSPLLGLRHCVCGGPMPRLILGVRYPFVLSPSHLLSASLPARTTSCLAFLLAGIAPATPAAGLFTSVSGTLSALAKTPTNTIRTLVPNPNSPPWHSPNCSMGQECVRRLSALPNPPHPHLVWCP